MAQTIARLIAAAVQEDGRVGVLAGSPSPHAWCCSGMTVHYVDLHCITYAVEVN